MLRALKPDILLTDLRMRVGPNAPRVDFARFCQKLGCVLAAAHNPEVVGSNPTPATNLFRENQWVRRG
jgi:hypothetical protein